VNTIRFGLFLIQIIEMSNIILFDAEVRTNLLPLTFARPVADLRVGILTIREKWERQLDMPASFLTQDYLQDQFPLKSGELNLLINGSILPTAEIVALILDLNIGQAYMKDGELVAACLSQESVLSLKNDDEMGQVEAFDIGDLKLLKITQPADVFTLNGLAIREDFLLLTAARQSAPLPASNTLIGPPDRLFIEEGVSIEACILNVQNGPIYLGKDSLFLEGSMVRGPFCAGDKSVVKMGTKIYGGTTLGPGVKVGGEINNVVFQANSNKGHDGFLGNAAIGEWCNIGADTNASNMKNDYGDVKVWSYAAGRRVSSGLQFHGLIMGDHSKVGINTMFNTGTVVGFSANVFGAGFQPVFIPSFSWGGVDRMISYRVDKAIATADRMMQRRGRELTESDKVIFEHIFNESAELRKKKH